MSLFFFCWKKNNKTLVSDHTKTINTNKPAILIDYFQDIYDDVNELNVHFVHWWDHYEIMIMMMDVAM